MGAGPEKLKEVSAGSGNGAGIGHADAVETEQARLLGEIFLENGGGDGGFSAQKSRSTYVRDAGTPASQSLSSGRNEGRDFTLAYHAFAASSSTHGTSPR